jgi:hypothetical protein
MFIKGSVIASRLVLEDYSTMVHTLLLSHCMKEATAQTHGMASTWTDG